MAVLLLSNGGVRCHCDWCLVLARFVVPLPPLWLALLRPGVRLGCDPTPKYHDCRRHHCHFHFHYHGSAAIVTMLAGH